MCGACWLKKESDLDVGCELKEWRVKAKRSGSVYNITDDLFACHLVCVVCVVKSCAIERESLCREALGFFFPKKEWAVLFICEQCVVKSGEWA